MKGSQKANAQKHEAELPRAPEQKKNHLPIMEITRSDRRLAIIQRKQADDLAVTWLAAGELFTTEFAFAIHVHDRRQPNPTKVLLFCLTSLTDCNVSGQFLDIYVCWKTLD